MELPVETKTVQILGQPEKVGDWVVIDSGMTKILAADSNPEEALRKAGFDPRGSTQKSQRPVLLQVTDPSMTCLY